MNLLSAAEQGSQLRDSSWWREGGLGCGVEVGGDVEAEKPFELFTPEGGMGPVWPFTWLPGHPTGYRTS